MSQLGVGGFALQVTAASQAPRCGRTRRCGCAAHLIFARALQSVVKSATASLSSRAAAAEVGAFFGVAVPPGCVSPGQNAPTAGEPTVAGSAAAAAVRQRTAQAIERICARAAFWERERTAVTVWLRGAAAADPL
eukprot:SAG11_NODE_3615_length_2337_cov_1.871761_2_plen_135_part_00